MNNVRNVAHKVPVWGWWIFSIAVLGAFIATFFVLMSDARASVFYGYGNPNKQVSAVEAAEIPVVPPPPPIHITPPEHVRAIYMSACAVGTPSLRDSMVSFIRKSSAPNLNAVVIDVKDYSGGISFETDNPKLAPFVSEKCGARDMKEYIAKLHTYNIYVIARITVFQDPMYTRAHQDEAVQRKGGGVWKDNHGLAFVDVGAKPFWDHIVTLGKESYDLGFDELNFDYVRFPSDGPMSLAVYSWDKGKTKPQALEEFFKYLSEQLRPSGAILSADLFGMTTTNEDDLNIGQVLERALPYFDFVDPMVYPSHYPSGFNNYKNVNANAYGIVNFSLARAVERAISSTTTVEAFGQIPIASTSPQQYQKPVFAASKIRPWLQSFDYPVPYTPAMVEEQIKATNDAGIEDWIFWDAANKYTSLRQVLGKIKVVDSSATSSMN